MSKGFENLLKMPLSYFEITKNMCVSCFDFVDLIIIVCFKFEKEVCEAREVGKKEKQQ